MQTLDNLQDKIALNSWLARVEMEQRGLMLGYDRDSVHALSNYVDANRDILHHDRANMVNLSGAYLGEAIRTVFGGERVMHAQGVGLKLDNGVMCFPFNKLHRHIDDPTDAIISFYDVTPLLPELTRARHNTHPAPPTDE